MAICFFRSQLKNSRRLLLSQLCFFGIASMGYDRIKIQFGFFFVQISKKLLIKQRIIEAAYLLYTLTAFSPKFLPLKIRGSKFAPLRSQVFVLQYNNGSMNKQ